MASFSSCLDCICIKCVNSSQENNKCHICDDVCMYRGTLKLASCNQFIAIKEELDKTNTEPAIYIEFDPRWLEQS